MIPIEDAKVQQKQEEQGKEKTVREQIFKEKSKLVFLPLAVDVFQEALFFPISMYLEMLLFFFLKSAQ